MLYVFDLIASNRIGFALFTLIFNIFAFIWRMHFHKKIGKAKVSALMASEEGRLLLKKAAVPELLLLAGAVCMVLLFLTANMGLIRTRSGNALPNLLSWGGMFTGFALALYNIYLLVTIGAALWMGKKQYSN